EGSQHGKALALFALRFSLFARIATTRRRDEQRPSGVLVQQCLAFGLVQLKMFPGFLHLGAFEVIDGELQLILQPYLAVLHRPAVWTDHPCDAVNAVHILEEGCDALQSIGQLHGDGVEIEAAALLKVGELRDLETVEHHLPADAPRAQRWRLPVVFLKLDVVLAEVDAECGERVKVQVLHVLRRRLQDDLVLHVLEQPVGVLAISAISGAARGLHIPHTIGLGAKHTQESFRRHGPRADLDVIRLLQNTAMLRPESLQAQYHVLKRQRILRGSQDSTSEHDKIAPYGRGSSLLTRPSWSRRIEWIIIMSLCSCVASESNRLSNFASTAPILASIFASSRLKSCRFIKIPTKTMSVGIATSVSNCQNG